MATKVGKVACARWHNNRGNGNVNARLGLGS